MIGPVLLIIIIMILYLKREKTPSILSVISHKNSGLATLEVAYVLTQSPPNYFVEITISYFIISVNNFFIHMSLYLPIYQHNSLYLYMNIIA